MARIRSIKPEFPQSESMGRVSRDARLLFVMLWPICDDHGRTRAASRMLASLLFPYDNDAAGLIDGWLDELERESCITRYEANGSTFLFINNWLIHQKIDKPSKPQFPEPPECLARIREDSLLEGKGKEGKGEEGSQEGIGAKAPSLAADQILSAYHSILPGCQHISVLNDKRKKRIAAVIKLARRVCAEQGWPYDAGSFWHAYFGECAKDAWMRGEVPNPKNPNWKQNLDVLIAEDRFAGVMDKAIANRGRQT